MADIAAVANGGALSLSMGLSGGNTYGCKQEREENTPYSVLEEQREVLDLIVRNQALLQFAEHQMATIMLSNHIKVAPSHMVRFLRGCTSNMRLQRQGLEGLIDDVSSTLTSNTDFYKQVSDSTLTEGVYAYIDELLKYLERTKLMIAGIDEHAVKASLEEYHKAVENFAEGFVSVLQKLLEAQQRIAPA